MTENNELVPVETVLEGTVTEHEDMILVREFAARINEGVVDTHYFERTARYWSDGEIPTLTGGDQTGWGNVKGPQYTGMFGSTNTVDPEELLEGEADVKRWQPLLLIPMTGRGDYMQSSTWQRANMNVLLEEYPDTFITIGYSSHDGQQLALPMDAMIPDHLADRIESLWGDSYELDSDATSKLEQEIIDEDWKSWLESDFHNELETAVAEIRGLDKYEVDLEEYVDALLTERSTDLQTVFWQAMEDTNTYPEFETSESCYIRDMGDVAKSAALTLTSTKELEA